MSNHLNKLIVIAGPTASGKTNTAIKLAKHFNTVVLSADSRQFYREMSIGTAKPDEHELAEVTHYFINSHSILENFSVGDYERDCLLLLSKLFKVHNVVILTGGSGLFIKAVTKGFDDIPGTNPEIRSKLNKELIEKGIGYLQEKLKVTDPGYYLKADISNPQRIIRALEVYELTGMPFSSYLKNKSNDRPFKVVQVGLNLERQQLYQRIDQRVNKMIADGLLDEVRLLLPYRNANALNTVGYKELFNYLDGTTDLQTAIKLIKQNTRRYAKRQLTWLRKDPSVTWMGALNPFLIEDIIRLSDTAI